MMNLKVPPKIIQMINQEGEGGQRVSADGSLRYVFFPLKNQQKNNKQTNQIPLNKKKIIKKITKSFSLSFSLIFHFDFVDFSFFVAVECMKRINRLLFMIFLYYFQLKIHLLLCNQFYFL